MTPLSHGGKLGILALVGGVLLACSTLLIVVLAFGGDRALSTSAWFVPLALGTLLALVALLLLERPSDVEADLPAATQCAACGRPIIEEWRLCPHCGELLACDLSLPTEGGPTRG